MVSDTVGECVCVFRKTQTFCYFSTNSYRFLQVSKHWSASSRLFDVGGIAYSITYSPALQRLIFITSIIFNNKYSNPDLKSRA